MRIRWPWRKRESKADAACIDCGVPISWFMSRCHGCQESGLQERWVYGWWEANLKEEHGD